MATQAQIKAKVKECMALANELYDFDLKYNELDITFKSKGQAAGYAWWRGHRFDAPCDTSYGLKFSTESASLDSDEMLNDTVPHEVAHLVCMYNKRYGKNHDIGWKRVCIALGGTGARTHSQTLTKARYKAQYEYRLGTSGETSKVGPKVHKNIQVRGHIYTNNKTRIKFGKDDFIRKISSEEHRREHMKKVVEYRAAAGSPSIPTSSPKRPTRKPRAPRRTPTTGSPSKKELAMIIYKAETDKDTIINLFMSELNMTAAGASTYFYNCRREA